MKHQLSGYFMAIASGALYGIISVVILFVARFDDVPSLFGMMVRMFLAGVLLLPFARRHLRTCRLTKDFLLRLLPAGVFLTSASILIYTALDTIPAGVGIALHYTYPLFVMLFSVALFHAQVTRTAVEALALSLLGVVLLCDGAVLPANAARGVVLALLSAAAFAAYYIWVERNRLGQMDAVLFTMLMSFLDAFLLALYNLATGRLLVSVNVGVWSLLAAAGVLAMLAILTQTLAIGRIGSVTTSILGTLQPIVCTLGSAIVLHEHLSARTLLGSMLVLGAVVAVTLGKKQKHTAVPQH